MRAKVIEEEGDGMTTDRGLQWYQTVGQYEQEQQTGMADSMRLNRNSNMKITDLKNSKYLTKTDFEAPQLVTIKGVATRNLAQEGQAPKNRAVMFFLEKEKGMVCNTTNLKRCAHYFGSDETDDWTGKKIVVYFDDEVEFGGEMVGGLRIRAPKQAKRVEPEEEAAPAPKRGMAGIQAMDSDVPFADPYKGRLAYIV